MAAHSYARLFFYSAVGEEEEKVLLWSGNESRTKR